MADARESRQTFRLEPTLLERIARWGERQGFVDRKGAVIRQDTVVAILERFLALEEGGQHVTALLDAHTDPVLREARAARRLAAMTLQALHFGAVLPPDWEMRWTPEQDDAFYAEVIAPALEDAS